MESSQELGSVPASGNFAGKAITKNGAYAWYVLLFLTLAYTVAFIDRQVLNLLVDPIKLDLLLSDTQISLLQGVAFMSTYIALGPLFGRWVDTGNRRNVLVFGVVVWSGFTVMCGLVSSFWGLFIARAGIGAAEACLAPAAWSLIADYFSKERLAPSRVGESLGLVRAVSAVLGAWLLFSAMPLYQQA